MLILWPVLLWESTFYGFQSKRRKFRLDRQIFYLLNEIVQICAGGETLIFNLELNCAQVELSLPH